MCPDLAGDLNLSRPYHTRSDRFFQLETVLRMLGRTWRDAECLFGV